MIKYIVLLIAIFSLLGCSNTKYELVCDDGVVIKDITDIRLKKRIDYFADISKEPKVYKVYFFDLSDGSSGSYSTSLDTKCEIK